MDEYVMGLLKKWNLANFIPIFEDAGIDSEIFEEIDESMLGNLFKKHECGFEKKFRKRYEERKNSLNSVAGKIIKKDVYELLTTTVRGKIAFQSFKLHKKVDTHLISDLVIENEMEMTNCYCILKNRFMELGKEISTIFSTEDDPIDETLFFYPSQKSCNGKKAVNCGGILYDKYLYLRKKLIQAGVISKPECIKEEFSVSITGDSDIVWLQSNDQPEEQVKSTWSSSFEKRERCNDVKLFFTTFKCLNTKFGYELLVTDFDKIHPKASDKLTSNWDSVVVAILKYAERKCKTYKYTSNDKELLDAGKGNILAFFYLLKILGLKYGKRKSVDDDPFAEYRIKFTKNSFILHVETENEFNEFKVLKEKHEDTNKIIEPYVVLVGKLLDEGSSNVAVYIVVHKCTFEIASNSILDAIDYCFKCMVVLNVEFPVACRLLWVFLNQYFYKVSLPQHYKSYACVTKVINEINNVMRDSSPSTTNPVNVTETEKSV